MLDLEIYFILVMKQNNKNKPLWFQATRKELLIMLSVTRDEERQCFSSDFLIKVNRFEMRLHDILFLMQ